MNICASVFLTMQSKVRWYGNRFAGSGDKLPFFQIGGNLPVGFFLPLVLNEE
jgi:hypothetical protein